MMPYRPTPYRIALTIGLTLALVVAANVGAWFYLQRSPVNPGITRVWQKWQLLERLDAPVDWLFVGDSACGAGIDPAVIETVLNGRALNLCTIANASVVNQAWQVARYVERFGPPAGGVVVMNTFHTWTRSADDLADMLTQVPDGVRHRYKPFLGSQQLLGYRLSALTALYHQEASVRYVLTSAFSRAQPTPEDRLKYVVNARGHVPENQAKPEHVARQIRETIAVYRTRSFEFSPQAQDALQVLQDLARELGFRLYVANSSIARELWADPHFARFYSSMNLALDRRIREGGSAKLILTNPPTFSNDEMDNIDHVVGSPAVRRLSTAVAEAVQVAKWDSASR